ncbi:MAG: tetratricopeptide repeat protein [Ilumatobacteraceae bacterium]
MSHLDAFGVPLTADDAAAVARYDAAVGQLLVLRNDPVALADKALAIDPGLIMAHVLKGIANILGTERGALPDAIESLRAGLALAGRATPRELGHLAALAAWVDGRLYDACAQWERVLVDHPDDALAMFTAHQGDFFLGQSSELRDRVARRLPQVERGSTLEGYYQGMYAFGLEEMGDYTKAESAALTALASDPRDAWAIHAGAHVMEMTNRVDDGIAWLSARVPEWTTDNFFAAHNWWHLSLYHADRLEWPEVLALYDTRIREGQSTAMLDLLDASALLWRLGLQGVDVGNRWDELAEIWTTHLDDAWYVFNDVHAMMAFVGAGRDDLAEQLLGVLQATAAGTNDNAAMTRDVGLPVARALLAFRQGRYEHVVELLSPVRAIAARAGGSNAQRDLLAQTLVAAAERAGYHSLARALLNERLALKPKSAMNQAWMQRVVGAATG